jgi:hypothetical protein
LSAKCVRLAALSSLVLCLLIGSSAGARDGHWEPPGITPSTASLGPVLEQFATKSGLTNEAYLQRVEQYALVAGGERVMSERTVRDSDFKAVTTIDGGAFSSGRAAGIRWRRTPNGLTRTISVDVQGDDLDRWPLGNLPFDPRSCTLAGESQTPRPSWVVEYHPENDVSHWFYIDKASSDLIREVWREGSVVVQLDFDDFRTVDGIRRAYHWKAGGSGQAADVTLLSIRATPVSQSDVARPPSHVTMYDGAPEGETNLHVTFKWGGSAIVARGSLEGHPVEYLIDSGTSQVLVDGGLAHSVGIHTFLGHGIARELSLGAIHLHDVAIQTTSLLGYGAQAIFGYELFASRVVHINYLNGEVGVLASVPDAALVRTFRLNVNCDAGMPIVAATVDRASGPAFALDTGSATVVVLRYLWEHDGADRTDLPAKSVAFYQIRYLEGPLVVDETQGNVVLGPVKVKGETVQIERPNKGDAIEPPLDGILGVNVLGGFNWWFDCADHTAWFKPE